MIALVDSPALPARRATIFCGLPTPTHASARRAAAIARAQILRAALDSTAPPVRPPRSRLTRRPQQRAAAAMTCLRWKAHCAQRPRRASASARWACGIPLVPMVDVTRASLRPLQQAARKPGRRRRRLPALPCPEGQVDVSRPRPDSQRPGSARQALVSRPRWAARDRPDTTPLQPQPRSRSLQRPRRGRAYGAPVAAEPYAAPPAQRAAPWSANPPCPRRP